MLTLVLGRGCYQYCTAIFNCWFNLYLVYGDEKKPWSKVWVRNI